MAAYSGYRMAQRYGLNIYRRIDRDDHSVVMDFMYSCFVTARIQKSAE